MSILAIGGGTGSAASWILKALGDPTISRACFSSYLFTDISVRFFERARKKFGAWEGMLDCRSLNIEQDLKI